MLADDPSRLIVHLKLGQLQHSHVQQLMKSSRKTKRVVFLIAHEEQALLDHIVGKVTGGKVRVSCLRNDACNVSAAVYPHTEHTLLYQLYLL